MSHIHIEGLSPYDGDWEIDLTSFTNRELNLIKRISGVRAGELQEALGARDNDLAVAFTIIALQRGGHERVDEDRIWDAPASAEIKLVVDEEEEASPPVEKPGESEKNGSSGEPSSNASERLASVQSLTGAQPSDTPAISDQKTSAI